MVSLLRWVVALSCALSSMSAWAQPAEVERLKAEAAAAMRDDNCTTAARKYDELAATLAGDATRADERLTARFLAGVCYEQLDRLPEAAEAYREVVYGGAPEALIGRAQPRLDGIEPLLPVAVTFVCDEPGLMIELEARPGEGRACEEAWSLPSGIYRGAAKAADGREAKLSVTVTPGVPEEVVVLMPAAAGRGLDAPAASVDAGPQRAQSRVLAWTLTGCAAAALAGGVAFNVLARESVDEGELAYLRYEQARAVRNADAAAAARDDVEAARSDAEASRLTSYVLLGVAVGLTGAAMWTWLDDSPPDEAGEASARAGAFWTPGGAGVSVGGSF